MSFSAKNKSVNGARAVFRVEFSRSNLKGRDSKIGNLTSKHIIQMLVLNLECVYLASARYFLLLTLLVFSR